MRRSRPMRPTKPSSATTAGGRTAANLDTEWMAQGLSCSALSSAPGVKSLGPCAIRSAKPAVGLARYAHSCPPRASQVMCARKAASSSGSASRKAR